MHANALLRAQIPAQVLCQRLHRGLAGIVRRAARRVGDALLAARHDDGRRRGILRTGLERGNVGIEPVDHSVEVGGKDLRRKGCQRECVMGELWQKRPQGRAVERSPQQVPCSHVLVGVGSMVAPGSVLG